jgi:hypothetical protein
VKKKIGFIDYFIDEWHANNYPKMISEGAYKDKFEDALAWEEITPEGKKPLDVWCKEMGIGKAESIEQVVAECDCIVVLSPDNTERHEDLADLPLRSGKPVYIDKPFAPSLEVAKRLFAKADKYGSPLMSSSALRFGSHLDGALKEIGTEPVKFASVRGGGRSFQIYGIHQIEMLVMSMGVGAKRVMQCGNGGWELMVVDYGDGRRAATNWEMNSPFALSVSYGEEKVVNVNDMPDFFPRFVDAMLGFFDTKTSVVPKEQTLEVAALVEAGIAALDCHDVWVPVPER